MTRDDLIENCAVAAFKTFQHDVAPEGHIGWGEATTEIRRTFRKMARAVIETYDNNLE